MVKLTCNSDVVSDVVSSVGAVVSLSLVVDDVLVVCDGASVHDAAAEAISIVVSMIAIVFFISFYIPFIYSVQHLGCNIYDASFELWLCLCKDVYSLLKAKKHNSSLPLI